VGEPEAGDGGDLQPAGLDVAVAAVVGVVGDGDLTPGQGPELLVQRGLVGLHDQQVGGVLSGDQPVGVLTLAVERIGGDHGGGEVQAVQQRQNRVISLVAWSMTASGCTCPWPWWPLPRRVLAVDRDRPTRPAGWWRWPAGRWLLAGQPGADARSRASGSTRASTRRTVASPGGCQAPAHGSHSERGQDLAGCVAGPLTDRGQGPGAGQHRADRDAEHADQRVPAAAPMSWVGDAGKVVEQAAALVGCQHGERGRMGARGNGGWWAGRHGGPVWS
jgi:hypothetical protein